MTEPLPSAGWQTVHQCKGQTIEAMALQAGATPWAWRAHRGEAAV
jgi:hypothetical protein